MNQPKRIFIIGHTGAGKALRGEVLAQRLGWQYVDANPGLERYIGRNLSEILGKAGEEAFHQCEAEIITRLLKQENIVVVLEEAVTDVEKNRKLLASEFVVYLKVSTEIQMQGWSQGRLPLLPIENLQAFLDQQHLERDHLYESVATITIESVAPEDDLQKIIKSLS